MLTSFILLGLIGVLIMAAVRIFGRRRHGGNPIGTNDMQRTVTAFVVAPVVASVVALIVAFAVYREFLTALIFASVTGTFGYLAAVVLGIPVYWLLRWRGLTSSWITAASGALIAMATGYAMWGAFMLLFGITGALGTIAGLTFWSIARPDRRHVA